jgi:hypothetical protein
MAEIKNEYFKCGKWFTDHIIKRKVVKDYVKSVQNQILLCKKEQRLNFIAANVFDTRNRIFSIDQIFNKFRSNNHSLVTYNDSILKSLKFVLLEQTKLINLSKLPPYKIITVEMSKVNRKKKLISISRSIDKVLQHMFLNFLEVLVEAELNSNFFIYRKECNVKMVFTSVYSQLNQAKSAGRMYICLIDIKKCFENFLHDQIKKLYPFPKNYSFLFCR